MSCVHLSKLRRFRLQHFTVKMLSGHAQVFSSLFLYWPQQHLTNCWEHKQRANEAFFVIIGNRENNVFACLWLKLWIQRRVLSQHCRVLKICKDDILVRSDEICIFILRCCLITMGCINACVLLINLTQYPHICSYTHLYADAHIYL